MGRRDDPVISARASDPLADEAAPAALPVPGRALSFGRGAVQGATLGFGDEIEGVIQSLGRKYLPESMGGGGDTDAGKSFGDMFRQSRDVSRNEVKAAEKAHPGYTLAGNLVGGLAPSIVAGGAWAGAPAYGVTEKLAKAAKGFAMAGGLGGTAALGASEADDAAGMAKDTLKGAGLGLALQAAAPVVASGASKLLRVVKDGIVKMVPEAEYLASKGVKNLTLGQMAPKSWINSLEQSAESVPILGDIIKRQRQAGREGWQQAVANEARAPGAPIPAPGNVASRLTEIVDGFHNAYDPISKVPVNAVDASGQPLSVAFQAAVKTPKVLAGDEARRVVSGFLEDAHSGLVNKVAQGQPLRAGDLIGVRSAIRQEIRGALQGANPDYKTAKLLQGAEQAVTDSLTAQLPAEASAALQATDQQYGKLMKVVDAVRRSGDMPNGFTPAQLSQAVKSGSEKLSYAQGGGGPMRTLAATGRATLDPTVAPTGARLIQMAAGIPGLKHATVGVASLGTTDIGKALLTGTSRPQQAASPYIQALIDLLQSGAKNPYLTGDVAEHVGQLAGGNQ